MMITQRRAPSETLRGQKKLLKNKVLKHGAP